MEGTHLYSFLNQLDSLLEGHLNGEEEQKFLFSMLLLRCANLEFEREYLRFNSEKPGSKAYPEEYLERGGIYLPFSLRWSRLKERRKSELRQGLYEAMCIIDGKCDKYKGLMYPDSAFVNLDDRQVTGIFDIMDEITGDDGEKAFSNLADFYEFMVQRSKDPSIKQMGEFYTPWQITDLIMNMMESKKGKIYDPCCGSGSMLVCAAEYMRKHHRPFQLYGHEANEQAWKIARMNLILRGLNADLGEAPMDMRSLDIHNDLKYDYVLGNPPFHGRGWEQEQLMNDSRWKYGVPSAKRGDFAWMQHMLYSLNEEGKMASIFSNGILASRRAEDRRIRAELLQDDILAAVMTLPAGMFHTTKVSVSVLFFDKKKKEACKGKVLFIDARKLGKSEKGMTRLTDEECRKLMQTYKNFENGICDDQKGFCRQLPISEIETETYSLAPEKYVSYEQQELPEWGDLEVRERCLEMELKELLYKNCVTLSDIFD